MKTETKWGYESFILMGDGTWFKQGPYPCPNVPPMPGRIGKTIFDDGTTIATKRTRAEELKCGDKVFVDGEIVTFNGQRVKKMCGTAGIVDGRPTPPYHDPGYYYYGRGLGLYHNNSYLQLIIEEPVPTSHII